MTTADAQKTVAGLGFKLKIEGSGGAVVDQMPKSYMKIASGSQIVVYTD
jgi:hypothetical protein